MPRQSKLSLFVKNSTIIQTIYNNLVKCAKIKTRSLIYRRYFIGSSSVASLTKNLKNYIELTKFRVVKLYRVLRRLSCPAVDLSLTESTRFDRVNRNQS
ncbi:hypothetical protein Hanom_Chr15g01378721 [Helianthus anomalus]